MSPAMTQLLQIGEFIGKSSSYALNVSETGVITTADVGDSINNRTAAYSQNGRAFIAVDSLPATAPPGWCPNQYASGCVRITFIFGATDTIIACPQKR